MTKILKLSVLTYSSSLFCYRPYALTSIKGSHLHNNDASLVSRSAHVLCWQCALKHSENHCAGPGGVACRVCPPGYMFGDDARGSVSFDPQRSWAPFCDVICIWSIVNVLSMTFDTWKKVLPSTRIPTNLLGVNIDTLLYSNQLNIAFIICFSR